MARPNMKQDDEAVPEIDFLKVLVVANSPINRIVMAKIVERSGLKPIVGSPETAAAMLRSLTPGAVILDGGVDNKECDGLIPAIAAARRSGDATLPAVILLSNRTGTPHSLSLPEIVDVVVAKPITPEKLQPVIERLITLARA
jgi:CheY-like chemotaxis protein